MKPVAGQAGISFPIAQTENQATINPYSEPAMSTLRLNYMGWWDQPQINSSLKMPREPAVQGRAQHAHPHTRTGLGRDIDSVKSQHL